MSSFRTTALAVVVLLAALPAGAQSDRDQNARQAADAPAVQGQTAPPDGFGPHGDVMRQGMMGMGGDGMTGSGAMSGGQGMMPMPGMMGMMVGDAGAGHIEGRLAFIKAELKITDAQSAQWAVFADAERAIAKSMSDMRQSMMSRRTAPKTLPERLALAQKAMAAHLDGLNKTAAALDRLYDTLSADQKKIADEIIIGPMGMPMGMM